MIEGYILLANRIRKELIDLGQVISRAEGALEAAGERDQDQDFYIDSAALNLHDLYVGLERIFHQIASTVDNSVPSSAEWHRDLLYQMTVDYQICAHRFYPMILCVLRMNFCVFGMSYAMCMHFHLTLIKLSV